MKINNLIQIVLFLIFSLSLSSCNSSDKWTKFKNEKIVNSEPGWYMGEQVLESEMKVFEGVGSSLLRVDIKKLIINSTNIFFFSKHLSVSKIQEFKYAKSDLPTPFVIERNSDKVKKLDFTSWYWGIAKDREYLQYVELFFDSKGSYLVFEALGGDYMSYYSGGSLFLYKKVKK